MLKSLNFVARIESKDMRAIGAYFRHAGAELETLSVTEYCAASDALTFRREVTRYTANLRNFTFIAENSAEIIATLQLLPPSRYWNSIEVKLVDEQDVSWSSLDAVLAEPRFRTLTRFSILSVAYGIPALTWETKPLMPLANARGILQ